ncbi:glycoside hydrolase family protein [Pelagibacterales bacterium SAG-MED31]|nr:glycoside hydrolase family protein [Pelagibacterales bacterium SAG-MED31]
MRYRELQKRIKENEGFSLKPYNDQLGFLTIGYGHLILPSESNLAKKKITKIKLEKIFIKDIKKAIKDYEKFLKKNTFNKNDEELLIEMVFQIGVKRVLKFKNLLSNMREKNKYLVCFEMMKSLWYNQTPNRVKKLIKTFLKNEKR